MGLRELVISGSKLSRAQTTIAAGTGSVDMGYTYILLSVGADAPCRVRLYSDSASISIDESRSTSSFDIDSRVGLTLDTGLDALTSSFTFAPPIIGTTFTSSQTWYNITNPGTNVTLGYYSIELNDTASRTTITIMADSLPTGSPVAEGSVSVPNGYLLLSGHSTPESRVRLYSNTEAVGPAELGRLFGEIPAEGTNLVADMMLDTASFTFKISPILQAFVLSPSYLSGDNQMRYLINNISPSESDITASFTIYPIET